MSRHDSIGILRLDFRLYKFKHLDILIFKTTRCCKKQGHHLDGSCRTQQITSSQEYSFKKNRNYLIVDDLLQSEKCRIQVKIKLCHKIFNRDREFEDADI